MLNRPYNYYRAFIFKYMVTSNNIHIEDSYKISKKDFKPILFSIGLQYPTNSVICNRSTFSLEMEWTTHNFLYKLGLFKSHTKDVDLNYPNKYEWLYCITGVLTWLFIK